MPQFDRRSLLLSSSAAWMAGALPALAQPGIPHKIFAHYMVCCPPAGSKVGVGDFQREIQLAQQAGIDGFALNCGAWNKEPYYRARSTLCFEAAKALEGKFGLIFSADSSTGLSSDEVVAMMTEFHNHPNYFRVNGRPLLSTSGGTQAWAQRILDGCKQAGISLCFVPYFSYGRELGLSDIDTVVSRTQWADGYFYFGAAGTGDNIAAVSLELARRWQALGKTYIASVTPYYRGGGPNYRAFETNGFESMAQEWQAAIDGKADFVEIVTWNDWGESTYIASFGEPPDASIWKTAWGPVLSHAAYLKASRYFIDWYKTGSKPVVTQDQLFYFYRLHPAHNGVLPARDDGLRRKDTLLDMVFATTLLAQPAQLTISSGATVRTFQAPAGMAHFRCPMALGEQHFKVVRNAKTVLEKSGEFPVALDFSTNYNYFSGSAGV